jgi:Fe-S-cluster containining protein
MQIENRSCRRCGECCRKGGPALHKQDLENVRSGKVPIRSLITVRKGELAHNPLNGVVQPVKNELVKIAGTKGKWSCLHYDESLGCTVYDVRPLACRVLDCRDTTGIAKLIETDTLSRRDILGSGHYLLPVIKQYEELCPCHWLLTIQKNYQKLSEVEKQVIAEQVRADLAFRSRVITELDLELEEELFYFGRPFFQLLQPLGVGIRESAGEIHLTWHRV